MWLYSGEVEKRDVGVNGFADFDGVNILVGGMATRRVARADFHRWKIHQSLVGERGRSEGLFAHGDQTLHQRVRRADRRRVEARAALSERAIGGGGANHLERLLIGIGIGGAHIYHEAAYVGHHIVLSAGVDDGGADFYWAQERRLLFER